MSTTQKISQAQHSHPKLNRDCWERILSYLDTRDVAKFFMPINRECRAIGLQATERVLVVTIRKFFLYSGENVTKKDLMTQAIGRLTGSLKSYISRRASSLEVIAIDVMANGRIAEGLLGFICGTCSKLMILHFQDMHLHPPTEEIRRIEILSNSLHIFATNLKVVLGRTDKESSPTLTAYAGPSAGALAYEKYECNIASNVRAMELDYTYASQHLSSFQHLKTLSICFTYSSSTEDGFWSTFLELPKLEILDLRKMSDADGNCTVLKNHMSLQTLSIHAVDCKFESFKNLLSLPQLSSLLIEYLAEHLREVLMLPAVDLTSSNLKHLSVACHECFLNFSQLLSAPYLESFFLSPSEVAIVEVEKHNFIQMLAERSVTINIMLHSDIAENVGFLRDKLSHLGFSHRSSPNFGVCFNLRVGNPEIPKHVEGYNIVDYLTGCRKRNPFVVEQCSCVQSLGKEFVWRKYVAWLLNDRIT